MHILRAAGLILLLFPAIPLQALDPMKSIDQYDHTMWNTEDGLPQNSVTAILQTRLGYIWFGTQEGLVRFDGVRFDIFDKSNVKAFASNSVTCLAEDREGSLWIGTTDGLLRYRSDSFQHFGEKEGLPGRTVNCLWSEPDGSILAATDSGNLFQFGSNRFTPVIQGTLEPNDSIRTIFRDRSGILHIGTVRQGAGQINSRGELIQDSEKELRNVPIRCIAEAQNGALWFGTSGQGLVSIHKGRIRKIGTRDGLCDEIVSTLLVDRDENLWIGTFGGLNRIRQDGSMDSFQVMEGSATNVILSLEEDLEGNLWVGTSAGGLHRFKNGTFTTLTQASGMKNDDVFSICQDGKGAMWFGTYGGGAYRLDQNILTSVSTINGLSSDVVLSVQASRNGSIWIGTAEGLNRLDNHGIRTYTVRDGLKSNTITAIYEDHEGELWIGTDGGGLSHLTGDRFTTWSLEDGLSHPIVTTVLKDREGTVWVGTDGGGLNYLQDGKIHHDNRDGLAEGMIMVLYQDGEGDIWIGTFGDGLYRISGSEVQHWTMREGLFNDAIFEILEDDSSHLWMSTNKGVFSVTKSQLDDVARGRLDRVGCKTYGTRDGMKSNECNGGVQPAGCRSKDGRLWFPTLKGAVVVDPEHTVTNTIPPPVVIQKVQSGDRVYSGRTPIVLEPGYDKCEFHYTGLSFFDPDRVLFRYMLSGYDHSWVEAGKRRTAFYTGLKPGRYTFRVIACNSDGIWNEEGATVSLTLLPFFTQTVWFYLLLSLIIGLGVLGLYRIRVNHLRRRERELERLVDDRTRDLLSVTRELESANKELQRLSSQDGLTGIPNRRLFEETLDGEWRRSLRTETPLSIIMIDIDHFKAYNDSMGHIKGDECLKIVADTLSGCLRRPGDLLARFGGEEFVAVLFNSDEQGALYTAETMRNAVRKQALPHPSSPIDTVVTISLGTATFRPSPSTSATALLSAADDALYEAKRAGRNTVCQSVLNG
ncbi:MAG TPA: two-component regulator propeller domain-containing protein [Thermoanaerobaculia bacterium]|nr:two-component regulator propeller domain-containing protein [Thermoanaerobaculia bacterium]HUM29844.1 two-component regulator propeller domain-containing protein [Thermoanaerobaculia bacterium]HXK68119.1 two-component regulator propeller domain-containing protein [Thermoanaerobaculia bacterium]